jgi:hypothetical protein
MRRRVLASAVIGTDDTTVPVQDPTLGKTRTGRLSLYRGDDDHPYLVFDYTPDRTAEGPERMLEGFEGYLQADAYSAYDGLYESGAIVEVFTAKCGLREPPSGRARCSGNLRTGPSRPRPVGPPAGGSGFARRFTVSLIRDVSAPPRPSRRLPARTIHS